MRKLIIGHVADGLRRPIVAVDFDGTLCEDRFPEIGPARLFVVGAVRALHNLGWRVIIHTCRANGAFSSGEIAGDRLHRCMEMLRWLRDEGVPYDQVWGLRIDHPDGLDFAFVFDHEQTGKPGADVYLDDKAINVNEGPGNIVQTAVGFAGR
jgi:hypothetical protein